MKKCLLLFVLAGFFATELPAAYQYTLGWENPASRTYQISLQTTPDPGAYTEFSLPLWRPGRYITQDFAAALSDFSAASESGPLNWTRVDRDTWRVSNPERGAITVSYAMYAATRDAGSSFLCNEYAYFNPANLFMFAGNRLDEPCTLRIKQMPAEWKAATPLMHAEIPNEFYAASYHDFIDSPTILSGGLHSFLRHIGDTDYWFHFQGEYEGGKAAEDAFLQGAEKIIAEQVSVFGKAPMREYHFIYLLLPFSMRHAVEHANASCYAVPVESMKSAASVSGLFAITSHEFWHLWNVKRIRPAALWPYRYDTPQYTRLHWFTEGVTDYYADLILARAGLYDEAAFFAQLAENIQSLENAWSSRVVSPSASSFESWLAPSGYMNPHRNSSYYPLGYRIGMLMDLRIREQTQGKKSLDDVMRYLYSTYYEKNQGVPEDGVQQAVEFITGKDWKAFFAAWVEGTQPIKYESFLDAFGLVLDKTPKAKGGWERIGISKAEESGYGLYLSLVQPGGDAEKAGLGDEDMLLTLNGRTASLSALNEALAKLKPGESFPVTYMNTSGGIIESRIVWTDTNRNYEYKLSLRPDASAAQRALLKSWLQSGL